ncbi:MAG: peptidoglycan DD-metalloendopeptidase family protein [Gammaproteobacteria bacterium]|nr:peptidoglycan DD-metalloendopeptidase family protein [Gammaproteobacteria bacterium]
MRNPLQRKLFAITLGCLLLAAPLSRSGAQADEETETRARLEQLKLAMTRLSSELQDDKRERGSLRAALRKSEVAIGKLQTDIQKTRQKLQWTKNQLAKLHRQREELLIARGEQQELISREIQTAYQMGRQGQLKILLNQEQPNTLARALAYYDYFYQARSAHIEQYLSVLERINVLEPEIASTAEQLQTTQSTLDRQRQKLVIGKRQREQDLANLNATIKTKDGRLQQMASDQRELERLLEVIEEAIAALQTPEDYQSFATLKGQMPWPLRGKPRNRYGKKRGAGTLRWQGLMIPAKEGSTVSAIHHGRVVFADWFRGSGLLLIIDHGDGYMSLYAHNQALLRDVGEWVSAGAEISTVGNSGGQQQAALYFEIRDQGKPTDPTQWLGRG